MELRKTWSELDLLPRRKELISPYMFTRDKVRIWEIVNMKVCNINFLRDNFHTDDFQSVKYLREHVKAIMSQHLISDIFNLYYHDSKSQIIAPIVQSNMLKFELLKVLNDSSIKVITNNYLFKSAIVTLEICRVLVKGILSKLNLGQITTLGNQLKANMTSEEATQEEIVSSKELVTEFLLLINSSDFQFQLRQAKEDAVKTIHDFSAIGISAHRIMNIGDKISTVLENLDIIKEHMKGIVINQSVIMKMVYKVVDKAVGFFSEKTSQTTNSLFETDSLEDIEDLFWLHPRFLNSQLTEITSNESSYFGKITVYLDISDSMDELIEIKSLSSGKTCTVSALLFAKSILLLMVKMGILDRIIPFNEDILNPINPTEAEILLITADGGTDLNMVIDDAKRRGSNALIITDCMDRIDVFNPSAFIIGTPGASLELEKDAKLFRTNKQAWVFNKEGTLLSLVD